MEPAELEGQLREIHPLDQQISEALAGAVYPLRPDHLVWVARENEAPPLLLSLLSGLSNRPYTSAADVRDSVEQQPAVEGP